MATLRVKQIAKERGLTLAKVAELLGVHPVNLSTALNGNPTLTTLTKIADALGVEVVELFEQTNKPNVSGFVKVGNKVWEINSVSDLEKALSKAKEL
ncbi:MAG: helix-turn-helix transcriptional regulator [Rikenellaceae bacterium]|nr:helix-turn-helix transcriptional regulator [Rikenellaceae bacterium]